MAVDPLNKRVEATLAGIDSALPAPAPVPEQPDLLPADEMPEYEPVAGVLDKLVTKAKVVKKAFSSPSSLTGSVMDEAGQAAQTVVNQAGEKAESTTIQGAKQKFQINSQINKAADETLPYRESKNRIEDSVGMPLTKQQQDKLKAAKQSQADSQIDKAIQEKLTYDEAKSQIETYIGGRLTKEQKDKLKAATKGNVAKPADEAVPPQPAPTQADMQAAIKSAEQFEEHPDFPGVLISRATDQQAKNVISAYGEEIGKVDFNFNYLQSEQDIDKAINATSKVFAAETDAAKRGVLSDAAVEDMASRLNIAPDLLKAKVGTTFNAEQLVAARHLLVRSAARLDDMTTKIKAMPAGTEDDKLLLEFRDQLATHAAIQLRLKAAQTETARALRSFRLPVDGSTGLSDPQQISSLLNEMGGRANLKNLANAYSELAMDQQARFAELAGTTTQQLGKVWKELYLMSIQSSPASAERNFFANMVGILARANDTAFASTAGRAIDKTIITPIFGSNTADEVMFSEAIIEYANFIWSLPKGIKTGTQAFVTDTPIYKVGKDVDKTPDPAISAKLFADPDTPMARGIDFLGKVIRLPARSNLAGDEMTKAMLASAESRRLAAREAILAMRNGVDESKALDGMAMQIANPSARLLDKIDQGVMEGTLQSDLGSFGNFLMQSRNKLDNMGAGPVGTFIAPFIKTVINAQKQMLARTPLGQLALKEIRDDYAAGGARRQMALGKAAQGAAVMGLFAQLALDGTCTGAGPTDPERRKFLRETTGWQPFSCKAGDAYYSYAGLEPIGGLIGVATTLAEIGSVYGKEGDDEWDDMLLYATLMPFKYIGELPFLSGVSKFVNMIEENARDPKGEKAREATRQFFGQAAATQVGGVVPVPMPFSGLLKQIEDTIDPLKREVTIDPSLPTEHKYFDFMFRSWLAKTPVLSKDVPVSRNIWGQEVKTGDNNALKWILPFNRSETDLDSDERKILEIAKARGKMPFAKPDRTIANVKMNDAEYSDLLLYMNRVTVDGKTFRDALGRAMTDSIHVKEMAGGAYEGVAQKMSSIVSEFKEAAVQSPAFAQLHPDFVSQVRKNQELAKRKYQQSVRVPMESDD